MIARFIIPDKFPSPFPLIDLHEIVTFVTNVYKAPSYAQSSCIKHPPMVSRKTEEHDLQCPKQGVVIQIEKVKPADHSSNHHFYRCIPLVTVP